MKLMIYSLFIICFTFGSCTTSKNREDLSYTSETLNLQKVSDHVYQHITYLQTESFGKVACNGMVVFDKNEAIIFDTPPDNDTAQELIQWIEKELNCKIKAIIPTHFHDDCLGGLDAFHNKDIPSYANNLTIQYAEVNQSTVPQNGFDKAFELQVGDKKVLINFFGEGHTKDNVVAYFPEEKVLFGGCLLKEVGAGKGYLGDANVNDWPSTVTKIKEEFPDLDIVIPGHGAIGSSELLDYTIQLFEKD